VFSLRHILPWLTLLPVSTWAHITDVPHEEPGWTLTPSILIPIAVALVLYIAGWVRSNCAAPSQHVVHSRVVDTRGGGSLASA